MHSYRVCESILTSAIPLPELTEADGAGDYHFDTIAGARLDPGNCEWVREWRQPDGNVWLWLGRRDGWSVLCFPEFADFWISSESKQIRCTPSPDVPRDTISHLLLDQVFPLLLSQSGRLVLHGSAVAGPQGAVAFLGMSGWGKSTLAASLSLNGFSLLTDDCLALSPDLRVIPSYPGLRLWPESKNRLFAQSTAVARVSHYSEKTRVGFSAPATAPQPLARIYVLTSPQSAPVEICFKPLSPREGFMQLLEYNFTLDAGDPGALTRQFLNLQSAAQSVPVTQLSFPRSYDSLPLVREAILQDLKAA